ncbi:MAG: DNA repair protein RecO [Caulobacterales bacterium]|jgi:DNA repair protein RecO (recombination protein O)
MEWTDDGVVLGARRHGESGAVAELFTREHGRFAAMVHGGSAKRMVGVLQAGNIVRAGWKARLSEQLGFFAPLELERAVAATLLNDAAALDALACATALLRGGLAERQANAPVYEALVVLIENFGEGAVWPALYARFELGVLTAAGYGLDLSQCALTGDTEDLAWVSPRTGRAASAIAGGPFADKLLALPAFLRDPEAEIVPGDVADAFALSGYFLERRIFDVKGEGLPDARRRLIERLGLSSRL